MCTVLLPPGDNPIAVNKYIISYTMTSYILRDLPFSRKEPLKSADDYIVILKNKFV